MNISKFKKQTLFISMIEGVKILFKNLDEETTLVVKPEGCSTTSQASSSTSYRSSITSRIRSCTNYLFCNQIIERPIIPHILQEPSFQSYNTPMEFSYRFPNQDDFLSHYFYFYPSILDRFAFLSKELGLSYSQIPLEEDSVLPYSFLGTGLRCLVNEGR